MNSTAPKKTSRHKSKLVYPERGGWNKQIKYGKTSSHRVAMYIHTNKVCRCGQNINQFRSLIAITWLISNFSPTRLHQTLQPRRNGHGSPFRQQGLPCKNNGRYSISDPICNCWHRTSNGTIDVYDYLMMLANYWGQLNAHGGGVVVLCRKIGLMSML